jgi:hypothetical protein
MQTNNTPLKKDELLARAELLALAIEVAFREKLHTLLTDPNTDPELLLTYLKMHEKREAMKLKEMTAQLKEREIALKEAIAERRLALDERKQAHNEKKLQYVMSESSPSKEKAPAPTPTPVVLAKPNEAAKPTVDSRIPVPALRQAA